MEAAESSRAISGLLTLTPIILARHFVEAAESSRVISGLLNDVEINPQSISMVAGKEVMFYTVSRFVAKDEMLPKNCDCWWLKNVTQIRYT